MRRRAAVGGVRLESGGHGRNTDSFALTDAYCEVRADSAPLTHKGNLGRRPHLPESYAPSEPTVIATLPKNSRETIRVALADLQGTHLVDVRVMATLDDDSGLTVPTKKGISVRVEQLPALIEALQDAEVEARRRGLIAA